MNKRQKILAQSITMALISAGGGVRLSAVYSMGG